MMIQPFRMIIACSVMCISNTFGQTTTLTVDADRTMFEIQPTMWGIFFEDINFAADGGVYAQLVKNRSFEFADPLMGWKAPDYNKFSTNKESGSITVINAGVEKNNNPRFARITLNNKQKPFHLINEGFFGMGIKRGETYHFSIDAIAATPVQLKAELVASEKVIADATLTVNSKRWKTYTVSVTSRATEAKAGLRLTFAGKGTVDIDLVSLFPSDTWKKRPGGLRADLVELLHDLKPGFLRFPGGCIVEGRDLSQRYQWKATVGKVNDRKVMINRWNNEFAHRPAPDYFQSFGLGFYEYFLLAEDLGAAPLPILNCGMACQFNSAELVPMAQLDPYIEDALDLIEFANGPTTSEWGKLRAEMGHPAPFNLKMIGVGNEQWGEQYIERYEVFAQAIKLRYPEVKIVSGAGPAADGELFEYASTELKKLNTDIIDEHYYRTPDWFFQNSKRYDGYDRKGPKIFAGEYAAQSVATVSPDNKNTWQTALSEAAFMTGLERNADVVHLASYAPLFAHVDGWQWTPNLIWYNTLKAYGTPNYYVQKLFSNNKGTHALSAKVGNENLTGQNSLYASAVWNKPTTEIIVKLVNASAQEKSVDVALTSSKKLSTTASVTVISSDLNAMNSTDEPVKVNPVTRNVPVKAKTARLVLQPNSLTVLKVKTR